MIELFFFELGFTLAEEAIDLDDDDTPDREEELPDLGDCFFTPCFVALRFNVLSGILCACLTLELCDPLDSSLAESELVISCF